MQIPKYDHQTLITSDNIRHRETWIPFSCPESAHPWLLPRVPRALSALEVQGLQLVGPGLSSALSRVRATAPLCGPLRRAEGRREGTPASPTGSRHTLQELLITRKTLRFTLKKSEKEARVILAEVITLLIFCGFQAALMVNPCPRRRCWRPEFNAWAGRVPWARAWPPPGYSCLENPCGQRSPVGYRPWGCKSHTRLNN